MSMAREEAIKVLKNGGIEVCGEADRISEFIAALDVALDALIPPTRENELEAENIELKERIVNWRNYMAPTREQVEKVWRGEWEWYDEEVGSPLEGIEREWGWRCSKCKAVLPDDFDDPDNPPAMRFCQWCGAPITDEAVEMVMERINEMEGMKK